MRALGHQLPRRSWLLAAAGTAALALAGLCWSARRAADVDALRWRATGWIGHALPPAEAEFQLGRALPDLTLFDDAGRSVRLREFAGHPVWLVFFRGADCPFCREQLHGLEQLAARITAAGVQLVGASPDPPQASARLRSELGLSFRLLSDQGERAVTALCAGRGHCQVLVDATGIVRWARFSESWSEGPAPDALLELARSL